MRRFCLVSAGIIALSVSIGLAQSGPYKVLKTQKVGGAGGFDYVYADVAGRRLYIPRTGNQASGVTPRISVFDLDTLAPVGEISPHSARGVAVDPKSGHGFASSKPVVMWDTKTLAVIKTIDVQGGPDGIMFDAFDGHVHVFSHSAPNDTVINAADGTVVGTIDLGGAPEQAQSDGKGTIYVDLEDKDAIAVVDTKAMKVTATYDISATCGGPAGLGLDIKNKILFATCHSAGKNGEQGKAAMAIVKADTGAVIMTLPIGNGTDGGGFNANTMEAFSSNGQAGTLSIIKEESPTKFSVEQELATAQGGNYKTMTIDTKTNRVLLIGAEYQAAPTPTTPPTPPPAGAPPGRGRGPGRSMVADSFAVMVVGK